MPLRDKSVAIKQAINHALNATQGQKRSYQQAINHALKATREHKPSYQTSY